jgi:hypothetical protein
VCFLYNSTCSQQAHSALLQTLLPPGQRHHLRRQLSLGLSSDAAAAPFSRQLGFDFFSFYFEVLYKAKYFSKNHQDIPK